MTRDSQLRQTITAGAATLGGVMLGFILATVLTVLKVVHVVAWSWLLVLMPALVPAGLLTIGGVAFILFAIYVMADDTYPGET